MPYKLVVTDDTPLFSAQAAQKLRELPKVVEGVVKLGAAYERQHHEYRNRTGNLQRSTVGKLVRRSASEIRAELRMGMPYASYVVGMGLSQIQTAANAVEAELQDVLERQFDPTKF
jgi:hypothetical protein